VFIFREGDIEAMTLTVAVDATVVSRRLKGAGRVVKSLLAAFPAVDPKRRYVALTWPEGASVLREAGIEDVVVLPAGRGLTWELLGLSRTAEREGADMVFTVREIVGFGGPPTLLHVFEPPAYRTGRDRGWKARSKDRLIVALLGGSLRRAAAVTAGSRSTADWIKRNYGVPAPVVYPGIDPFFAERRSPMSSEPVTTFFLHLASGDPRDNTDLVLDAFARAAIPNATLVTVGTPAKLASKLREQAAVLGIAEGVDIRGWVSDAALRDLYAGALALLHPSRYEGFGGYPALEAMAQGTPVVALAAPGTREALGNAVLLIEQEDADEVAVALRRLVHDSALRAELGTLGRARTASLTWDATARAFADLFHNIGVTR
jgi:glycosyltransferase involved in cell wall biosynthesis